MTIKVLVVREMLSDNSEVFDCVIVGADHYDIIGRTKQNTPAIVTLHCTSEKDAEFLRDQIQAYVVDVSAE